MFSRNDKRHNAEWYMNRVNNIYDKKYQEDQEVERQDLKRLSGNSVFFN